MIRAEDYRNVYLASRVRLGRNQFFPHSKCGGHAPSRLGIPDAIQHQRALSGRGISLQDDIETARTQESSSSCRQTRDAGAVQHFYLYYVAQGSGLAFDSCRSSARDESAGGEAIEQGDNGQSRAYQGEVQQPVRDAPARHAGYRSRQKRSPWSAGAYDARTWLPKPYGLYRS